MDISKGGQNMASSPKTKITFATLPREIRDKVYENMLTESKTISASQCATDYGQPEDWGTLRATMHACRISPRFAEEAFETFFRINTFTVPAGLNLGFLSRAVYYVNGRGFKTMMMFVTSIEVGLIVGQILAGQNEEKSGLCGCFHKLLACPVLRHVTVEVGLGWFADDRSMPKDAVGLAELEIILAATTVMYQKLKVKIGEGLKFETRYVRMGEKIKVWEERMGKAAFKEA